jgi:hypothetical protein
LSVFSICLPSLELVKITVTNYESILGWRLARSETRRPFMDTPRISESQSVALRQPAKDRLIASASIKDFDFI